MPLGSKQPKPPPNYMSRRVQVRLLIAVVSLLLVVTLMFEARKPANWEWMWSGTRQNEAESDAFDTRLPPIESGDPIGTVYANREVDTASMMKQAAKGERSNTLRQLKLDAWAKLLARLDRTDRTALDRVLLSARTDDTARTDNVPSTNIDPNWQTALDKISHSYESHLNDANEAVMLSGDSLADTQKESLLNGLRDMEVAWTGNLLPALRAPLESRPWTKVDRGHLNELQLLLDELAVKAIQDDSFWRADERDAWFRWFEFLQKTAPAQLQRQSTGQVGFLQLFKQSDDYRGKLVTIRGTARLAYRVRAPENIHGITGYVVYWVKPAGGPNSPIVVYALETPARFPEVKDKGQESGADQLDEEVAFTGFYFKRWAYLGHDGLQTAPLILARAPMWVASASGDGQHEFPELKVAIGSIAAVLALSVMLALLAYRASSSPSSTATSLRKSDRAQLEALKKQPVLPSPEEALRQLAAADKENASE